MWQLKQTVSFHKVLIRMATLTRRHRQVNTESSFASGGGQIENDEFRNNSGGSYAFPLKGTSKQLTALGLTKYFYKSLQK